MKKSLISRRVAILAAASLSFLAACGGGGDSAVDSTAPADAVECANPDVKVLSLSPTATEMLYAIGAGDSVVAVDSLSTYPAEVASKVTKISAFEPNAEAILGYDPDLVLISNDMNNISSQLTTADPEITVWTGAAATSLDDVYTQIAELGAATCKVAEASALVDSMKERIAAATDGVTAPEGTSYFYELDNTLYSVTSNTFVGSLLAQFGLENIADGAQEGNDYPQLSAEVIIEKDPTLIFLADTKCCGQNAAEVAKRAGWGDLSAVTNDGIVELDDDVASRWGPRLVDLVEQFSAAVKGLSTP
jgi:iron complex transport system substrate-binding protein